MKLNRLGRSLLIPLVSALVSFLFATLSFAAGSTNVDKSGVAVHGYDPVAYFTDSKPVKGTAERSFAVEGVTYWFVNDQNLAAFKADPGKYAPQYGGYCAYGVAQGYKPDIDPTAFKVVEGKLYLNLSPDVQSRWVKDIPGYINDADKNWKTLVSK
jgi:YHS domain-containing protein